MLGSSLAILTTIYFLTKPQINSHSFAPAFGQLVENRNILSPVMFAGKAGKAYKIAAEIPKVIDSLFCYCY